MASTQTRFHQEFFSKQQDRHGELVSYIIQNRDRIARMALSSDWEVGEEELWYSVEEICKRPNGFIIGYCDVVLGFPVMKDGQKAHMQLCIDAKPKLREWGGPLRQIKTYVDTLRIREYLGREYVGYRYRETTIGALASFEPLNPTYRDILYSQQVLFLRFTDAGEIVAE